jgi:hypothetical protein
VCGHPKNNCAACCCCCCCCKLAVDCHCLCYAECRTSPFRRCMWSSTHNSSASHH